MPIFDYRTEAQDGSGHFRQGSQQADSKEHARQVIEERERDFAAFQMHPDRVQELLDTHGAASLDDLPVAAPVDASEEEKEPFRQLPVRDRAHLSLHRQEKPYKLVRLERSRKKDNN